jgi:ubiquinone/menaquinone biosynthesis C-methylase UbiE
MDRIPDVSYRIMASIIRGHEVLFNFSQRLDQFGIQEGYHVIDYGCGPGRYVTKASTLIGPTGKVYTVDIHPLAIRDVEKLIKRKGLKNVKAVLVKGYSCPLSDNIADLIYVLDAFHMIHDPVTFLNEIHRLLKKSGYLILDDGHLSREETLRKVTACGSFTMQVETNQYLKYIPREKEV